MIYIKKQGISLLEVILVVTALFLLTGITVLAINPGDKLGDKNNTQRRVDIQVVLDAIYQYSVDHGGNPPKTITATSTEICLTGSGCRGLISLSALTLDHKYLKNLPVDPDGATDNGTNYFISRSPDGKITISAPRAEKGENISVTR